MEPPHQHVSLACLSQLEQLHTLRHYKVEAHQTSFPTNIPCRINALCQHAILTCLAHLEQLSSILQLDTLQHPQIDAWQNSFIIALPDPINSRHQHGSSICLSHPSRIHLLRITKLRAGQHNLHQMKQIHHGNAPRFLLLVGSPMRINLIGIRRSLYLRLHQRMNSLWTIETRRFMHRLLSCSCSTQQRNLLTPNSPNRRPLIHSRESRILSPAPDLSHSDVQELPNRRPSRIHSRESQMHSPAQGLSHSDVEELESQSRRPPRQRAPAAVLTKRKMRPNTLLSCDQR